MLYAKGVRICLFIEFATIDFALAHFGSVLWCGSISPSGHHCFVKPFIALATLLHKAPSIETYHLIREEKRCKDFLVSDETCCKKMLFFAPTMKKNKVLQSIHSLSVIANALFCAACTVLLIIRFLGFVALGPWVHPSLTGEMIFAVFSAL